MGDVRNGRFLSLVLRHRPDLIGITLDDGGWTSVRDLLAALAAHGRPMTRDQLLATVEGDDKQRYALDVGADRIRANQGHSVAVDLGLQATDPPAVLYHGTPVRNVDSVLRDGLHRAARHHVHLSPDVATATRVGARRGRPAVLAVDAAAMVAAGHIFHRSANGVWLTARVPPAYLTVTVAGTRPSRRESTSRATVER